MSPFLEFFLVVSCSALTFSISVRILFDGFPEIHIGTKNITTNNHYYDDDDDDYEEEDIPPAPTPYKTKMPELYN